VYLSPGQHGDYDISSYGGDEVPGGESEDADINSWD
jgi:general secretion pathway protein G